MCGTQYRSAIFPLDDAQRAEAAAAIARGERRTRRAGRDHHRRSGNLVSGGGLSSGILEGEGQRNPYCLAVIPPKLQKLRKGFAEKLKL